MKDIMQPIYLMPIIFCIIIILLASLGHYLNKEAREYCNSIGYDGSKKATHCNECYYTAAGDKVCDEEAYKIPKATGDMNG